MILNLNYKLSKEDTDGLNWDHIENRGSATVFVPLHEKYDLSVSGEVKYQDFENNHATFGVQREDTTYTLSSVLTYDLYKSADLQVLYAHINFLGMQWLSRMTATDWSGCLLPV